MENRDRTTNQGGQGQGNKPGQGGSQKPGQGGGQQGGREGQGQSDKPSTRPSPSGVPNEGRSTAGSEGRQDQGLRTGKGDYEYKGGRQGTGGIPNPDDQDDRDSAGSFRGTAEPDTRDDDEDGNEQIVGEGQPSEYDSAAQKRPANHSANQRRVVPSNDQKR